MSYKKGQRYRLDDDIGCADARKGDVVIITQDSDVPRFKVERTGNYCCYHSEGFGRYAVLLTETGDQPVQKRTFKLLKETEWLSKGALFQEETPGSTSSAYKLVTLESFRFEDASGIRTAGCLRSRESVEDNPKWFVEVFQVEPQYMTQSELDQFESFKKNLTKKKVTKK